MLAAMPTVFRSGGFAAAVACAALLAAFAAVAWVAASAKSPAYDEPYHALSAWLQLRHRDYRLDNEDPPLWQYWASLPNGPDAIRADFGSAEWERMPHALVNQWGWCVDTLYHTPGNDATRFVARCRAMMLALGVALGGLVGWWAFRLGGPAAAVAAVGLYCLDPNFLGHAPLMKNDVCFSLALLALAYAVWRAGRRLTAARAAVVAALSAVMLTTKFSGLSVAFLLPLLLGTRALLPAPWPAFGRTVATRRCRLAVAAGLCAASAAVGYAGIWAAYGFRYSATPDPAVSLNLAEIADRSIQYTATAATAEHPRDPPTPPADRPPAPVRLALWADAHRLFPQAYVAGFLFTYTNNLVRPAFLFGQISLVGWWYYFPAAMAMKTPVATVVAVAAAAVVVARRLTRRPVGPAAVWAAAAVGLPAAAFMASAMRSNLNIGLRHVLPVYPFAFVAAGWAVAAVWAARRRWVLALFVAVAAETAHAFPDYVAFFNAPSRLAGDGGWQLLGDSNLDWGQDLTTLADWLAKTRPAEPLYLSYFGLADPAYYGIRYVPLPHLYGFTGPPRYPDPYAPALIAISVNHLQLRRLLDPTAHAYFDLWAAREPIAVLGGTLRVYQYDPAAEVARPKPRP